MPRYVVQRTFPDGLEIPTDARGAVACLGVVDNNSTAGVTWVHSYVTPDKSLTYCIYDGPTPEAVRDVAGLNGLPVDHITEVRVLDPYFYYAG
jgi:Nickel responsive protein SCO4226-like